MRIIPSALAATLTAFAAQADAPKVVADILPVQALVSKIMAGVGSSTQLLPANVSPHGYAMRPSEARVLQAADLVVWVGPELTPMLEESLPSLAPDAISLSLLHLNGTRELEFRESETFLEMSLGGKDTHGHDDHHDGDHKDAHDEHADHDDAGHDAHDDHKDEHGHDDHDSHDAHSHEGVDPHAWLDPENARFWVSTIALKLAEIDPGNAATYRANAADLDLELAALSESIQSQMAPLADHGFVVFHDAYQYFETQFGLSASGALLDGDGASPSAARLSSIRDTLKERNISCVFTEPQFNNKVIKSISDGLDLHSEELDPLGVKLDAPDYAALLQNVANAFEACLAH